MLIKAHLKNFYEENNIPLHELENDQKWFVANFGIFKMKFPNPKWRKKVLHVHDIHHLITEQNTSWKGEAYITGWEIATHLWLRFPIGMFIWLATSYTVLTKPVSLFKGFKNGINYKGPIHLNKSKEEFLITDLEDVKQALYVYPNRKLNLLWVLYFVIACFWSVLFTISPLLIILLIIFFF